MAANRRTTDCALRIADSARDAITASDRARRIVTWTEVETFLAGLAASMEEGLLTLDADGLIVTANGAAEQMLGYEREALAGRTLCDCLGCRREDPRSCPLAACWRTAVDASSEPVRFEDELFTRKDGSKLAVALSVAPLRCDRRLPSGHVVVFQDISERKAASEHGALELEELTWIGRLRDAMDEERLVLAAQPIVSLASRDVVAHELLLRLRDRAAQLVMPGRFLPAAERFGLVRELDRWVLGRAARLLARGHSVNVNLSAHSLGDPELAVLIERTLADAGADPRLVTFEITETALTEHPRLACAFAKRMASLGCTFALDDFGTGYGAFTYLKLLPISYLKIDREFVNDVSESAASCHVIEAMVSLARGFGQQTIAEGVEDEPTLDVLRQLGVDHVQGFHIARPGPVEQVIGAPVRARSPRAERGPPGLIARG
jgi:PAS domain S-box-containing protein